MNNLACISCCIYAGTCSINFQKWKLQGQKIRAFVPLIAIAQLPQMEQSLLSRACIYFPTAWPTRMSTQFSHFTQSDRWKFTWPFLFCIFPKGHLLTNPTTLQPAIPCVSQACRHAGLDFSACEPCFSGGGWQTTKTAGKALQTSGPALPTATQADASPWKTLPEPLKDIF